MAYKKEEDLPLMNAHEEEEDDPKVNAVDWDNFQDNHEYLSDDASCISDSEGVADEDDPEEIRRRQEPDFEGRFHDDPLWWGKTLPEIKACTDRAKAEGNQAHRDGDLEGAVKHWKGALKGAQKLKDNDAEFRVRLNLAMGYTKLGKTAKALKQCEEALRDSLRASVSPALQAKAHYRKADVYEAVGETTKAIFSLKSAIQIEPGNKEARQKYTNLKNLELERRKREKALFAGKNLFGSEERREDTSNPQLDGQEPQDVKEDQHSDDDESDDGADEYAADFDVNSLTDRSAADQLFGEKNIRLGGGIDFVGGEMKIFGPAKQVSDDKLKDDESEGVAF